MGNNQAPSAAAASVLMTMAKPLPTTSERGVQAKTQLTMTAAATTACTGLERRMGGTTMAMNML